MQHNNALTSQDTPSGSNANDCTDCDISRMSVDREVTPQASSSTAPVVSSSAARVSGNQNTTSIASPQAGPSTFDPPSLQSHRPSITIEFCDRCRWAPRASWIQTELFLTFPVPIIRSITLQPLTAPETGGRFRVWVYLDDVVQCVWDRKSEGGFPELKVLKQRIRNILQPDLNLGHSDVVKPDRGKSDQPQSLQAESAAGAVTGAEGTYKDMQSFQVNNEDHPGLVFMKGDEMPSEAQRAFNNWALRF